MFPVNVKNREQLMQQLSMHFYNACAFSLLADTRCPLMFVPQEVPGVKKAPTSLVSTDYAKLEKWKAKGSAASLQRAAELESKMRRESALHPIIPDREKIVRGSDVYWYVYIPAFVYYMGNKNQPNGTYKPRNIQVELGHITRNSIVRNWMQNDAITTDSYYPLYDFAYRTGYTNNSRTKIEKEIARLMMDYFSYEYIFLQVFNNPIIKVGDVIKEVR